MLILYIHLFIKIMLGNENSTGKSCPISNIFKLNFIGTEPIFKDFSANSAPISVRNCGKKDIENRKNLIFELWKIRKTKTQSCQ